jgi:hypothetical protein
MIDVRMRERFREVLDADFKVRCRSGRIIGEIGNLRRPARHQFLMAILSAPSSCGVKARCFRNPRWGNVRCAARFELRWP